MPVCLKIRASSLALYRLVLHSADYEFSVHCWKYVYILIQVFRVLRSAIPFSFIGKGGQTKCSTDIPVLLQTIGASHDTPNQILEPRIL